MYLAETEGVEPPTPSFVAKRSSSELRLNKVHFKIVSFDELTFLVLIRQN
jgi:hypothetical protein